MGPACLPFIDGEAQVMSRTSCRNQRSTLSTFKTIHHFSWDFRAYTFEARTKAFSRADTTVTWSKLRSRWWTSAAWRMEDFNASASPHHKWSQSTFRTTQVVPYLILRHRFFAGQHKVKVRPARPWLNAAELLCSVQFSRRRAESSLTNPCLSAGHPEWSR